MVSEETTVVEEQVTPESIQVPSEVTMEVQVKQQTQEPKEETVTEEFFDVPEEQIMGTETVTPNGNCRDGVAQTSRGTASTNRTTV